MELTLAGQRMIFLPEKALLWAEKGVLLLADLHIGKAAHFRKNGIGLGRGPLQTDLARLAKLLDNHGPTEVLILGDLFHSTANGEWESFFAFVESRSETSFTLVPGNHDRHLPRTQAPHKLLTAELLERRPPFLFSHEPAAEVPEGQINICGHQHPGVRLGGKGRMRDILPCFWVQRERVVLPAFGTLTGLMHIQAQAGDQVIAVAGAECLLFGNT